MTDTALKLKPNKWWYIGGGTAAIAVYLYHRKNKALAQQTASNAATSTTDSTTYDPTTDPNSPYYDGGYGYGYGGSSGATLTGYSDPYGSYITNGTGTVATQTVTAPSTNAAWAQSVESYMVNAGYDAQAVGSAIGHYLNGVALTADEASIVETALAFEGAPPQGAPTIHLVGSPAPVTQPAGGGTGGGTGTGGTPAPLPAPQISTPNSNTIRWSSVPGASRYHIYQDGKGYTERTDFSMQVPRGHTYAVAAVDSHGRVSPNTSKTVRL